MTAAGAIIYLAVLLAAAGVVLRLGKRGADPRAVSFGLAALALVAYVGLTGWRSAWLTAMAAGAVFMVGFLALVSARGAPPVLPNPADETGGPKGPEPTRYGDWERKGRAIDF